MGNQRVIKGSGFADRTADSHAVRLANQTRGLPPKAVPVETLPFPDPSATRKRIFAGLGSPVFETVIYRNIFRLSLLSFCRKGGIMFL